MTEIQGRLAEGLRLAATTDPLTGLVNRRAWESEAGRVLVKERRRLYNLELFQFANVEPLREGVGSFHAMFSVGDQVRASRCCMRSIGATRPSQPEAPAGTAASGVMR